MDLIFNKIPETARRFLVPIVSFILLVVVMGLDPLILAELITYILIGTTAVTGYVEYRRFAKARTAEEKKLPSHDINGP